MWFSITVEPASEKGNDCDLQDRKQAGPSLLELQSRRFLNLTLSGRTPISSGTIQSRSKSLKRKDNK
jgi:hypothetical protein